MAVLLLDLDDSKTVNDSLGHPARDALLRGVAERLLNATRGCDTVARLGGDEFAVLVEHVRCDADAVIVAERVLGALTQPFAVGAVAEPVGADTNADTNADMDADSLDGTEVLVRASVGIARASAGATSMRCCAMRTWRCIGRSNGGGVLRGVRARTARRRARLALHGDLRRALDGDRSAGEPFVVYQPVVGMDDGRVTGAEALVRWRHPRCGLVSPSEFVPIAEQTGLVIPLGRLVPGEACRQGAAWATLGSKVRVGVNLSARQLPTAAADVGAALTVAGLEAGRLTIEVTGGTLVGDTDATQDAPAALEAMGVGLAIDDFGTGYSSLSYLQRFPMDVLKIDKSFVDRVAGQGRAAALARTIVALGDSLGLYAVAEGVETEAQRSRWRSAAGSARATCSRVRCPPTR